MCVCANNLFYKLKFQKCCQSARCTSNVCVCFLAAPVGVQLGVGKHSRCKVHYGSILAVQVDREGTNTRRAKCTLAASVVHSSVGKGQTLEVQSALREHPWRTVWSGRGKTTQTQHTHNYSSWEIAHNNNANP